MLFRSEVIIGIIKERLAEPDCAKGFILDGVPRTIAQAEALEAAGIRFDHVVSLEVSDETIEERMSGRRVCEHCGASYHIKAVPPRTEGVCDVCGGKLVTRKDDAPVSYTHLDVYKRQDHPHGGGEGKAPVGRPGPVTPWGKPAMGYKTRSKKNPTNKMCIRDSSSSVSGSSTTSSTPLAPMTHGTPAKRPASPYSPVSSALAGRMTFSSCSTA